MATIRNLPKNSLLFGSLAAWALLLISCVSTGNTPIPAAVAPKVAGATLVGSQACVPCHDNVTNHFSDTTHSSLIASGKKGVEQGCESCHGPASQHVKSGGGAGTIVKGSSACATCHRDIQARFSMTSHHPLNEGILTCTSCHSAHGRKSSTLTSTNATCTSCHQSVRGPHTFEHAPAAESCTNCHNPHGSPVRKMLTASQPMLCLQCHSLPNNLHGQTGANANATPISTAALRNCSTCHSAIHGSSQDEHLRY